MKKSWRRLLVILVLLTGLNAIDVTIDPSTVQVDLGNVNIDSGFYDSTDTQGNIKLTISNKLPGTPAELSAHITDLMSNADGFQIPEGSLKWQIFWASTDGSKWTGVDTSSSSGFNSWVSYRVLTDDRILVVDQAVNTNVSVTLGTQISRVPAVQPVGKYTTRIIYTVTQ